ncbi:hypothetical protein [Mucilaginibacter psychrotolerans]|uniref:Addiction module protein n=1 Tax=Mucilaginibacter psychrotolerans TaxID=1524096 RepID=A0A4Y8S8A5_9SPHI|nr:hypothetical protein [Mucilaginibacter psychrotolerans]TFF34845.1 hypothetical protein E2R66_20915 [Mucilaginibacter psychrotolerans]
MTTTAIRERLYEYIRDADDKKVEALYVILEGEIVQGYDWSEDKEFVAELDEEYKRYEDGVDKGITLEELEVSLELNRKQRGGK